MEEAKLKMQTLKERYELERQLEVAEQSKTEVNRKRNLLNAEAELKQAKIDFVIDQIPDDESVDGMNAYLQGFQNPVSINKSEVPHFSQPEFGLECPPVPQHQAIQIETPLPLPHDHTSPGPIQDTPDVTASSDVHDSSRLDVPGVGLDVTSKEFHPNPKPNAAVTLPEQPVPPPQEQVDVWNSIAQAIKEGPSLPKIELMRFSGDPLEYVEFMTNFKDNIECQVSDESQRFTRLLAQCVGKAKDAIRSCVNLDANQRYKEAKNCLLENFGQPHIIVEAHMKKLREIQIRRSDASSLMEFVRHLDDSERALKSMGPSYSNRLDNEDVIVMLMRKLPDEGLKRRWADKAGDLIKSNGVVQFDDFVQFLKKVAGRINNRFGRELKQQNEDEKPFNRPRFRQRRRANVNAIHGGTDEENSPAKAGHKCQQCSGPHGIWRCQVFKSLATKDRLKTVKQHKLCRICLGEGHFARSCRSGFTCRIAGCGKQHHYLIHGDQNGKDDDPNKNNQEKEIQKNSLKKEAATQSSTGEERQNLINLNMSTSETTGLSNEPVNIGAVKASRPRVCFKVVPVKVSSASSGKEVVTYAFSDGGSDTTLCLETLVQELAVQDAKPTKYMMTTVNCQQQKSGYEVQLDIESVSGGERFQLEGILTMDSLPVTPRHVATNEEVRRWPHLQDIILPETGDKQVTILIGSDHPDIIDSCRDRRDGTKGQPCAVKTPLGWTVYGPMGESANQQVSVSFARSEFDILDRKLERMYNAEFDDINDDVVENMSMEDRRAEDIMNMTTVLKDGHYQIGLPFKHNPPRLPDSLPTAKKQLEYLKLKMERDENFRKKYSGVMEKYREEGAAREVPKEELATLKPLWYLPHHAVWHPRKPEEPRVVFDCASKTNGTSLNDELLRGPENTSSLIR